MGPIIRTTRIGAEVRQAAAAVAAGALTRCGDRAPATPITDPALSAQAALPLGADK